MLDLHSTAYSAWPVHSPQSPAYSGGPLKHPGPTQPCAYCRSCSSLRIELGIRRALQALYYTQGFAGPELYTGLYRPCSICSVVQAMHYTLGCAGPALYAGFCRPCSICTRGPTLYAGLCRPGIIHRAVQATNYTQNCTHSALYAGLSRPCTICSAVQALH